ncbi:uncharacterized protein LOC142357998 isoform X2 [Convolutriloba macropyga]|uniref:uncharacterized protein LOC142357998 isoform X2 n=1 Tax=Convolutriloba macropyga TaxID=536237 RepID=UPI003F521868
MDVEGAMGSVECAICLSHPLDARELECCEQIICGGCITRVCGYENQTCPLCRKENFKAHPVRGALRRLLESASIPCPNECGATMAVGNLKDHNRTCPKQPMDCKFCNETFISNNFMGLG